MNGNGSRLRLLEQIELTRDALLDLEIVVDDSRRTVDAAVEDFKSAVRERNRAAAHLAALIGEHEAIAALLEPLEPLPELWALVDAAGVEAA
jgi:hypothetical protein